MDDHQRGAGQRRPKATFTLPQLYETLSRVEMSVKSTSKHGKLGTQIVSDQDLLEAVLLQIQQAIWEYEQALTVWIWYLLGLEDKVKQERIAHLLNMSRASLSKTHRLNERQNYPELVHALEQVRADIYGKQTEVGYEPRS